MCSHWHLSTQGFPQFFLLFLNIMTCLVHPGLPLTADNPCIPCFPLILIIIMVLDIESCLVEIYPWTRRVLANNTAIQISHYIFALYKTIAKQHFATNDIKFYSILSVGPILCIILLVLSTIKLERQFFRTGRRIAPKFCTRVRI